VWVRIRIWCRSKSQLSAQTGSNRVSFRYLGVKTSAVITTSPINQPVHNQSRIVTIALGGVAIHIQAQFRGANTIESGNGDNMMRAVAVHPIAPPSTCRHGFLFQGLCLKGWS